MTKLVDRIAIAITSGAKLAMAEMWATGTITERTNIPTNRAILTSATAMTRMLYSAKNYEKAASVHGSRCQWFQAIFVMQPRQNRDGNDSLAIRDAAPILSREPAERHVGNA